jgi:hypothetical protein
MKTSGNSGLSKGRLFLELMNDAKQRLTLSDRDFIAEEMDRNANIIARYHDKNRDVMPANVARALEREMAQLRALAHKIRPQLEIEEAE